MTKNIFVHEERVSLRTILTSYSHPGNKANQNRQRPRTVVYDIDGQREAIEENSIEGT